jgi:hypothetical protein
MSSIRKAKTRTVRPSLTYEDYSSAIGKTFGRVTVRRIVATTENGTTKIRLDCACLCGKIWEPLADNVIRGATRSCGCVRSERCASGVLQRTHDISKTPEYQAWASMKKRCENPKHRCYQYYGGRGIKIAKRWLGKNGFINFFLDMGQRPSLNHSLDRINNNGNYKPSNCRWATRIEQVRNRRNSKRVTINGFSGTLIEAAEWGGVPFELLRHRYRRGVRGIDLIYKGNLQNRHKERDLNQVEVTA